MVYSTPEGMKVGSPTEEEITAHLNLDDAKVETPENEKGYEDVIKPILTVKINVNRGPVDFDTFCDLTKKKYGDRVDVIAMPCDNDADAGITWSFPGESSEEMVTLVKMDDGAELPSYAKEGDYCMDIKTISVEYDAEHDNYIYHTGLHFEMPTDIEMIAFVRSSNRKTEAYLTNHVGVIDNGYRGEVVATFKNRTSYKVNCMLAEWEYMKNATNNVNFDDAQNVGETMEKLKANAVEPFKKPDPMDFAPYEVGAKTIQIAFVKKLKMKMVETKEELTETERGEGGHGSTGK